MGKWSDKYHSISTHGRVLDVRAKYDGKEYSMHIIGRNQTHTLLSIKNKIETTKSDHIVPIIEVDKYDSLRDFVLYPKETQKLSEYITHSPDQRELCDIIVQISTGLKELHNLGIVHGYLTPQHIFKDETRFKIGNFHKSILMNEEHDKKTGTLSDRTYMSPDAITHLQAYSFADDLFSLGCIVFRLLTSETDMKINGRSFGESILLGLSYSALQEHINRVLANSFDSKLVEFIHSLFNRQADDKLLENITEHINKPTLPIYGKLENKQTIYL